jgi:hypothetical protein
MSRPNGDQPAPNRAHELRLLGEAFPAGTTLIDPLLLVGRERQLVEIVQALQNPGLCPIVFGPRGIGKSALAWQAELAVKGSTEVLDAAGAGRYTLAPGQSYLTFTVSCASRSVKTGGDLLLSIAGVLRRRMEEFVTTGQLTPVEQQINVSLGLSPKFEVNRKYGQRKLDAKADDIEEALVELATDLTVSSGQPVLVVVDDFERITDIDDFAGFLRTAAGINPVDFRVILVGSAHRVSSLLGDHGQLERVAMPIEVPPMSDRELIMVIEKGLAKLCGSGSRYEFPEELMQTIATVAAGIPSTTTQLARESIRAAERDGVRVIGRRHVDRALRDFVAILKGSQ